MRMPYFTINRFPKLKATKNNMVTINENNIKKEDILSIQKTNDMYILIFCGYGRG